MAQENATISKTIIINVDSTTIKKDIQLLLTFEDMASGNFENVAWKISDVHYHPGVIQSVPITFESILAFSIASKQKEKFIMPGETIAMELKESVEIVQDRNQLTFKNKVTDKKIPANQIVARNNAGTKVDVSVGFLTGAIFSSAAYIAELGNKNQWIATYKPVMNLYITSNATTGQTINTIAKSDVVFAWDMASADVPDQSRWFLKMEDDGSYKVTSGEK